MHQVIATARNPSKMAHFKGLEIETAVLDVLSPESIQQCVSSVKAQYGALDMLINDSGRGYSMPPSDASLGESRQLFELNVWSVLAVIQAFLPILLKANHGAMIINNTSISSDVPNPMGGIYNMSKAATAMMTDTRSRSSLR
jgi:1-acylglycerone phosphate reductase